MRKTHISSLSILLVLLLTFTLALPTQAQDSTRCDLDDAQEYVSRGDEKQNVNDHESAIDDYTCALELDNSNVDALFGRGFSLQALGDDDRAERDYTALLEIDPTNGSAYNNRGNIYLARQDYEHALADYDRAIQYDDAGNRAIPYANRGSLHSQLGESELAIDDLNQALEIDPSYRSAYLTRAFVYRELGDDSSALNDLQSWLETGEITEIEIDPDTLTEGESFDISEGWIYRLPVEAKNGTVIRAEADGASTPVVDPMMILLDEDGVPVAWNDDIEGSLDSVLKFKFEKAGTYELLITHAGGGSEGQFTLSVEVVTKGDEV